jgi:D-hexose-6-phosphate mutarotase
MSPQTPAHLICGLLDLFTAHIEHTHCCSPRHLAGTEEMSFTAALHTYFKISAIGNVSVSGLDGITYTDSLQGGQSVQQSGDVIFDQEVDRIYLAVPDSGVQVRIGLWYFVAMLHWLMAST